MLVSTDKAVRAGDRDGRLEGARRVRAGGRLGALPGTRYAAVRFGNVLGSSGSVVPIFRRQIARGGPVTVTDERMTRYFMTIPEAVQLIIRSGSLGSGGRSADGAPRCSCSTWASRCAIVELARAMIELSGLDPDRDIEIEIVGAARRREAARGAVQRLRALCADDRREDPARRARAAGGRDGRGDVRGDRPAGVGRRRGWPGGEGVRAVGRA